MDYHILAVLDCPHEYICRAKTYTPPKTAASSGGKKTQRRLIIYYIIIPYYIR